MYDMSGCKPGNTLVAKGEKFSFKQYLKNDFEHKEMQKIPYASAVGSRGGYGSVWFDLKQNHKPNQTILPIETEPLKIRLVRFDL